jgi:hypothetical protein
MISQFSFISHPFTPILPVFQVDRCAPCLAQVQGLEDGQVVRDTWEQSTSNTVYQQDVEKGVSFKNAKQ